MTPFDKPILNTKAQIAHLKSKGVKFEIEGIEAAEKYLENLSSGHIERTSQNTQGDRMRGSILA